MRRSGKVQGSGLPAVIQGRPGKRPADGRRELLIALFCLLVFILSSSFVFVSVTEARTAPLPYKFAFSGLASIQYEKEWTLSGANLATNSSFVQEYSVGLTGPILDPRIAYFRTFASFTYHDSNVQQSYRTTAFGIRVNLLNRLNGIRNPKYFFLLYLPRPISVQYWRGSNHGLVQSATTRYGLSTSYNLPYYFQLLSGGKLFGVKSVAEVNAKSKLLKKKKVKNDDEEENNENDINNNENNNKTNKGNGNREADNNNQDGNDNDNTDTAGGRNKAKRGRPDADNEMTTDNPTFLRWTAKYDLEAPELLLLPFPHIYFDIEKYSTTDGAIRNESTSLDLRARISGNNYLYTFLYSSLVESDTRFGAVKHNRAYKLDATNKLYSFNVNSYAYYEVNQDDHSFSARSDASMAADFPNYQYAFTFGGSYGNSSVADDYSLYSNGFYEKRLVSKLVPALVYNTRIGASVSTSRAGVSNTASGFSSGNTSASGTTAAESLSMSDYYLSLLESLDYKGVRDVNMAWDLYCDVSKTNMPYGTQFRVATTKWKPLRIKANYFINQTKYIGDERHYLSQTPGTVNPEIDQGSIVQQRGRDVSTVQGGTLSADTRLYRLNVSASYTYRLLSGGGPSTVAHGLSLAASGRILPFVSVFGQLNRTFTKTGDLQNGTDRVDLGIHGTYRAHNLNLGGYAARDNTRNFSSKGRDAFGWSLSYNAKIRRNATLFVGWTYDNDRAVDKIMTELFTRLIWTYGRVSVDAEYYLKKSRETAVALPVTEQRIFLKVSRSFGKIL